MKAIFHNDDFGLSYAATDGAKEAYLAGIATSISIRTNGKAFDYSLNLLKKEMKGVGVGIHLNLTDGPSHLGKLKYGESNAATVINYIKKLRSGDSRYRVMIKSELEKQFEICFDRGLPIDHVDGQDHVHMIPEIFEITCQLCNKFGVRAIRLSRENWFFPKGLGFYYQSLINLNPVKHILLNKWAKANLITLQKYKLKTTSSFYGVIFSNNMVYEVISSALKDAIERNHEIVEILSHPAKINHPQDKTYTSNFIKEYSNLENRKLELNALTSKELKDLVTELKIQRVTFGDI